MQLFYLVYLLLVNFSKKNLIACAFISYSTKNLFFTKKKIIFIHPFPNYTPMNILITQPLNTLRERKTSILSK